MTHMKCMYAFVMTMIVAVLTDCAAITNEPKSESSYQPDYGYVTSAYFYPGYNYYPSRPTVFETHDVSKHH